MRILLLTMLLLISGSADAHKPSWKPAWKAVARTWAVTWENDYGCQSFDDLQSLFFSFQAKDLTPYHRFGAEKCQRIEGGTKVWISQKKFFRDGFFGLRVRPQGATPDVWMLPYYLKPAK